MTERLKPPTAKRRPKKRAESMVETRRALIAAGLALFGEQGLDAPSLDAICDRAGYTRGAFYVHFKDREDFLVAAMESLIDDYLANVFPHNHGGPIDLARTIQGFAASAANRVSPLGPHSTVRLQHLVDACSRSPRVREHFEGVVRRIIDRVAVATEGAAKGAIIRDDVRSRSIASLLVTVALGVQVGIDSGVRVPVHEYVETMLALLAPRTK